MIALAKHDYLKPVVSNIIKFLVCAGMLAPPAVYAFEGAVPSDPDARAATENSQNFQGDDSGSLTAAQPGGDKLGACALKHTDVHADISGYVARVTVKQTFQNLYKDKIEALYTFPLPENAAVDDMLMTVGSRTIHGTIYRREEAQQIYQSAKKRGYVASLLEQERPNVFTQSVANIEPGKEIEITLQYSELMPYKDGRYTFAFPTVVGPRFMPGTEKGYQGTGWAKDTDLVSDASRISPPVAGKGQRSGHDISLSLDIDAGMPIGEIESCLHQVKVESVDRQKVHIGLVDKNTIPNKDFVLKWEVASSWLQSGFLVHKTGKSGYLSLMLVPPLQVKQKQIAPKEMIFLLDCSGSQSGEPIKKAKETLQYIVEHMNRHDTFQVVSFNNETSTLFDKPQEASAGMKAKAKEYIASLEANGGTWMAPAVEKVCAIPADDHRLRVVTFMTDGYVGNDFEVLGLIHKLRNKSRWFAFGTGNSVNRFLIDGIAKEGGGEAEYVLLNDDGKQVAKRFYERISKPLLTDVSLKFEGVEVTDVVPRQLSDVWAQKPLYFKARYTKPGTGTVKLTGFSGGKPYEQILPLTLPEQAPENSALPQVWAKAVVGELMSADWFGMQNGSSSAEIKEEIVRLALAHHIMTEFTSFVAVDESALTKPGAPKQVVVPVEMPDGVSYDKIFADMDIKVNRAIESSNSPLNVGIKMVKSARQGDVPLMAGSPTTVTNWLLASSRDANLFSGGSESSASSNMSLPTSPTQSISVAQQTNKEVPPASLNYASAPYLCGATNGCIGPSGQDATVISGINTAGSVRVNNLVNLELWMQSIATMIELLIIAVGGLYIFRGAMCLWRKQPGAAHAFISGVLILVVGFLSSPLLLLWIVWKLPGLFVKGCRFLASGIRSLAKVKVAA